MGGFTQGVTRVTLSIWNVKCARLTNKNVILVAWHGKKKPWVCTQLAGGCLSIRQKQKHCQLERSPARCWIQQCSGSTSDALQATGRSTSVSNYCTKKTRQGSAVEQQRPAVEAQPVPTTASHNTSALVPQTGPDIHT